MNSVSITAPLRETGTPPKGRSRRSSRRRPQQPYVRLEVLSANEVARRDSAGAACPPQARQRVTWRGMSCILQHIAEVERNEPAESFSFVALTPSSPPKSNMSDVG